MGSRDLARGWGPQEKSRGVGRRAGRGERGAGQGRGGEGAGGGGRRARQGSRLGGVGRGPRSGERVAGWRELGREGAGQRAGSGAWGEGRGRGEENGGGELGRGAGGAEPSGLGSGAGSRGGGGGALAGAGQGPSIHGTKPTLLRTPEAPLPGAAAASGPRGRRCLGRKGDEGGAGLPRLLRRPPGAHPVPGSPTQLQAQGGAGACGSCLLGALGTGGFRGGAPTAAPPPGRARTGAGWWGRRRELSGRASPAPPHPQPAPRRRPCASSRSGPSSCPLPAGPARGARPEPRRNFGLPGLCCSPAPEARLSPPPEQGAPGSEPTVGRASPTLHRGRSPEEDSRGRRPSEGAELRV